MDRSFDMGFCLGALWGIACGVFVVAPYVRDAKARRGREVQAAVADAFYNERVRAQMMAPTPEAA